MPELTLDQALAELPDTADGIADRMRALGIKGMQDRMACCPLAEYLRGKGFANALICEDDLTLTACESLTGPEVDLADAQAEFVRRFDAGVYLDLVEVP